MHVERYQQSSNHEGRSGSLPKIAKVVLAGTAALAASTAVAWKTATYTPDKSSIVRSGGYSDRFKPASPRSPLPLTIPEIEDSLHVARYTIEPGWIEKNIQAPFLQEDKGHFHWLREGIVGNPIVTDVTKDFFTYLLLKKSEGRRVSLGEMLTYVFGRSYQALSNIERKSISPSLRDNLDLEAVHLGLFALGGGLAASWWNEEDLKSLGMPIDGYKDVNSFYWHTTGLGTVVLPKFFGIERQNDDLWLTDHNRAPIYGGADRAIHVVQHAIIAFSYLYAGRFNLPDKETLPNGVKWWVKFNGKRDKNEEVRVLSRTIGNVYELQTTRDGISGWLKDPREQITEGVLDPMNGLDRKANTLGTEIGIALFERVIHEIAINDLLDELSDPKRFASAATEPALSEAVNSKTYVLKTT